MAEKSDKVRECQYARRRDYFGVMLDVDPAGRRIWPPEVTQRLATASFDSGLSMEQFAAEWDVNPSSLSKWRMAEKAGRAPKQPRKRAKAKSEPPLFVEAVVSGSSPRDVVRPGSDHIEIDGGGVSVRVPITAGHDLLLTILTAMRGDR
jgi:transposase-like protein